LPAEIADAEQVVEFGRLPAGLLQDASPDHVAAAWRGLESRELSAAPRIEFCRLVDFTQRRLPA
jgi:hypothetical protein